MKLWKKILCIALAALLLLSAVYVIFFAGNDLKTGQIPSAQLYGEDLQLEPAAGETALLENDRLRFALDTKTAHFTVTDKKTGVSFSSVAAQAEAGAGASELVVDYFDSNSVQRTMYSQDNSVDFGSFEVRAGNEAVQVWYDIRKNKDIFFVPSVLTKEVFENQFLEGLEIGPQRRLKMYYKLRTAEDKAYLDAYPALEEQELYILIDSLGSNDFLEITDFCNTVGYTPEQYAQDTADMEISDASVTAPAQFTVPVEYRLTEDGFSARLLTGKITTQSPENILSEVHLLPAYASAETGETGYLFVPDGSGAVIEFDKARDAKYLQSVYGEDLAVDRVQTQQLSRSVRMPVFGINRAAMGFFGIIEGSAENATVCGQVQGSANAFTGVYAKFLIRPYDVSEQDIAAANGRPVFNIYAQKPVSADPVVRYALLSEDQCDYSAMARYYQSYLVEKGVLGERLQESPAALHMDFTGYLTQDATFLGLPYEQQVVLSTLSDIQAAVDALERDGVDKLTVRLKDYGYGGTYHALAEGFRLEKTVGTQEQLQTLAKTLQEKGGLLYLEHTPDEVYQDGLLDSFRKLTHATRKTNRMVVMRSADDLVAQTITKKYNTRYCISPLYYEGLIEGFAQGVQTRLGSTQLYGYAWGGFGSRLTGDYRYNQSIDRTQAAAMAQSAVEQAAPFAGVLTEGGNIYSAAQADILLNVPLSDSGYQYVTYAVPFYQMVLHGYRHMTGMALNQVSDGQTEWLNTVEGGCGMYYACITEPYTILKDLEYRQTLYPVTQSLSHAQIAERYAQYSALFSKLSTQTIEKHTVAENGVRITTYEDGTSVLVNYSDQALQWNGIRIEAKSFAVQQEEQV